MPKRVIDFDALWGSDKLAACAEWAQAEYAWLYGLADASGCFEMTNLRVIWGRVAAIRRNLKIERLEQIFDEFQDKGLLFVWEHEGKRYGHWTGSDVPGRLPPPSWRMRLERFAPPVPKQRLGEYMARFARGRAALASAGFQAAERESAREGNSNCRYEISNLREQPANTARENRAEILRATARTRDAGGFEARGGLKAGVEAAQAQDLNLDWNGNGDWNGEAAGKSRTAGAASEQDRVDTGIFRKEQGKTFSLDSISEAIANSRSSSAGQSAPAANSNAMARPNAMSRSDWKALALERELRVGQGPACGPVHVRPEVLERVRKRDAASRSIGTARAGSRSP